MSFDWFLLYLVLCTGIPMAALYVFLYVSSTCSRNRCTNCKWDGIIPSDNYCVQCGTELNWERR